jgi:hypothetical protein
MQIKVTCTIEVPVDATKEQITEWVRFNLSQSGSIGRNPLLEHPCEAIWETIDWEYTR